MKTEWRCYLCEHAPWIDNGEYEDHMFGHEFRSQGIAGMKTPLSWDEYIRRWGPIGLTEIRTIEDV